MRQAFDLAYVAGVLAGCLANMALFVLFAAVIVTFAGNFFWLPFVGFMVAVLCIQCAFVGWRLAGAGGDGGDARVGLRAGWRDALRILRWPLKG